LAPLQPHRLEQTAFGILAAFVVALQFSIAASNVLLAATAVCWVTILVRERRRPSAPGFFLALSAFAVATLISSVFSLSPRESLVDSRQLLLFAIVPIVYDLVTPTRARQVTVLIITAGAVSAAVGIVQYSLFHFDSLAHRPEGMLTHYMTYSGELMLVVCIAAAQLVFARRERSWPALVMPALLVALVVTFTRNAWVGVLAGTALLFALRDVRLLALLPMVVALVFAFAPERITDRMVSMFDLRDPSNRDRLAMTRTAAAIIRDRPLTGVGPNMIPQVYARYRDKDAVHETSPHLHNVPLQIAAERGLPALAAWLWFVIAVAITLLRQVRRQIEVPLAAGGLAALAAMIAAGLFEHNFGDSEFLMLFLVLITLPCAAARERTV
jgi:O-antigen ligase